MSTRVFCTGIGFVNSLGLEPLEVFEKMYPGMSGITKLEGDKNNGQPIPVAAVNFDPFQWMTATELSGVDRISQMAVAATEIAKRHATLTDLSGHQVGVFYGTGMGGAQSLEASYRGHFSANPRVSPLAIVSGMTNAGAAQVAIRNKIYGPVMTYSVACASSAIAVGEAFEKIKSGRLEMAIVIGAESLLEAGIIRAWQSMRTLASLDPSDPTLSSKPFDRARSGLVLAEGATCLILENESRVRARRAHCLAEVVGYGLACDASHIAKPDVNGQVLAIKECLKSAAISAEQVDYINAHGTATTVGDVVEDQSIRAALGKHGSMVAVSSTKSMHGHQLGGAGALEAALTVLSIDQQKILPTATCHQKDPDIQINVICRQGVQPQKLDYALSNSFAFGGTNAVLAFKKVS